MVPFSLKSAVKDANRNSTGCFSKIYMTSHQSISISLAFEASVPPLFSVRWDPKSGSWLPPRGVFSEDATAASAHTYCTTQACPCFKAGLRTTASSSWVLNAALFHWHWGLCRTLPSQFGSRYPGWKSVEIISLFCRSKSTSSLCHYLQLQAGWPANHRLCKET